MSSNLKIDILPQPDDYTCGPTCLHAVYRYYGDDMPLEQVVQEVPRMDCGGTLDVLLANHALRRGYRVLIYTYNLQMFDPTWFIPLKGANHVADLADRLREQAKHKSSPRLDMATEGYLEFLELGGELRFADLTTSLLRKYLNRSTPVLTGLSSTFLYRSKREFGPNDEPDDVRGEPAGHFVVLCGYDREAREVLIADPLQSNPITGLQHYVVNIERLVCAILLGIVTYDSNLLIIEPRAPGKQGRHAGTNRR